MSRRERNRAAKQQRAQKSRTPVQHPQPPPPDSPPPAATTTEREEPEAVTIASQPEPAPASGDVASAGTTVLIQPRDPLVARDARPFSNDPGARAFTLPWPYPRTVAGTIRTHIGNQSANGMNWTHAQASNALKTGVHGPLMVGRNDSGDPWTVYVPAPRDVVFHRPESRKDESEEDAAKRLEAMVLRPVANAGGGFSQPAPNDRVRAKNGFDLASKNAPLHPLLVTKEVKPETNVPAWWRLDDAIAWLRHPAAALPLPFDVDGEGVRQVKGAGKVPRDSRTHVSIENDSQTNVDGALFTTESLAFPDGFLKEELPGSLPCQMAMVCHVRNGMAWDEADALIPLGGERRLSMLSVPSPDQLQWPSPPDPPAGWEQAKGLRLQLVTPAIFAYGWLPDWIGNGTIVGLRQSKLGLKLVGAAIDRRVPVSGWRLAKRNDSWNRPPHHQRRTNVVEPGPRATQYAVPAGGVYFFRVTRGTLTKDIWDKLWLMPVSDLAVDRDQGFGLVLPGVWDAASFHHLDDPQSASADQEQLS